MSVVEVTCLHFNDRGETIACAENGARFILPTAWPGEKLLVNVLSYPGRNERFGEASVVSMVDPSPHRISPFCAHHGACGGCPWMGIAYEEQLRAKEKRIREALSRNDLEQETALLSPVTPSPKIRSHRNRAQIKTDGSVLGYVERRGKKLVAIDYCPALNEKLQALFKQAQSHLPNEKWLPSSDHAYSFFDLDDEMESFDDMILNKRRPFRQGNHEINGLMKEWLASKICSLSQRTPCLELFAGSGNFTEVLSSHFEKVWAVELASSAVTHLEKLIPSDQVFRLDLFKSLDIRTLHEKASKAQLLIMDPPREGLAKKSAIFEGLSHLKYMGYISCSLDSFSRDLAFLVKRGWSVKAIDPMDAFPHTPHVEILAWLERT